MRRLTDDEIRAHTIGELLPHAAPILIVDYDPAWPALFEREAAAFGRRWGIERL